MMKRILLLSLMVVLSMGSQACSKKGPPGEAEKLGNILVSGTIELDPKFTDRIGPLTALYVIARGPDGKIVAVKKIGGPFEFPVGFSLEPQDQMLGPSPWPEQFSLKVRLDQDGIANQEAPGDLIGTPKAQLIKRGAKQVQVRIDREIK